MAEPPWVTPPPASHLNLNYDHFSWCQIQYVFTNELVREDQSTDWYSAYDEAGKVVEALHASPTPMAPGAAEDEVVWPLLICAANRYAVLTPAERAQERQNIAAGKSLWQLGAAVADPAMCDPAAVDDPEYRPVPPCIPRQVTSGLVTAGGFMAGIIGTYLCLSVVLSTQD